MTHYLTALSPAEEAQFREDVHAVLEEVKGGLVEEGLAMDSPRELRP